MNRRSVYIRILTLLAALCIIGAVSVHTAYAAPEDSEQVQWGEQDDNEEYEGGDVNDLPDAEGQVEEATAVPMPEEGAAESSMVSGIVMWLCVALGVAVLVGVMVSKRTGRRG